MAAELDNVDLKLLEELERDADRTNVDLARIVELSPAATLHRVRRLKDAGVVDRITAHVDPDAAGFPLQVYVSVTLARHDDTGDRRFVQAVNDMPEVLSADWVTGETDALLWVVARDVAQLQRVLSLLSTKAGGARVVTLLRLSELKPRANLPYNDEGPPPKERPSRRSGAARR